MSAAAAVREAQIIDLSEFRRRREEARSQAEPANNQSAPIVWLPVWVVFPAWPHL